MNEISKNSDATNICEGCPALYALGGYADQTEGYSESRQQMVEQESLAAREFLAIAAGKIACRDLKKHLPELPDEIPKTGTSELISLVSECPSFPTYMHERTGQPVLLIKAALGLKKVINRLPRKS